MRGTWWFASLLLGLTACGPRELRVSMKSDNNSGQTGFAVIQELNKTLSVTVETTVPEFVGEMGQLAHIHRGTCGEILEAAVTLTRLTRLAGTDRFGSTTEKITLLKLDDFKVGDWAINVHDERDRSVYVSCGEIPKP